MPGGPRCGGSTAGGGETTGSGGGPGGPAGGPGGPGGMDGSTGGRGETIGVPCSWARMWAQQANTSAAAAHCSLMGASPCVAHVWKLILLSYGTALAQVWNSCQRV